MSLLFTYTITYYNMFQNSILDFEGTALDPKPSAQVGIVIVISLNALAIGISLLALGLYSGLV